MKLVHYLCHPTRHLGVTCVWADPALMPQDAIYFAYFSPYTLGRHQQLVADMQCSPRVALQVLGQTLDGHDLDLLRLGEHLPSWNFMIVLLETIDTLAALFKHFGETSQSHCASLSFPSATPSLD